MQRQLATDITNFSSGALGLVELAASYLNDRKLRRWSKPELIVYINEAQDSVAEAINAAYKEYFITSATTPTVSGQSLYSLPADLNELIHMEVVDNISTDNEPKDLVEVLLPDKKFYETLEAANRKEGYGFFFIQGTDFRMLPAVTSSSQFVRVFYVQKLVALVNNGDVSKVPGQHHELLAIKAARRAHLKNERINRALEVLHSEAMDILTEAVQKFSRNREQRRMPWRGTYGPIPITGRVG